MDSKTDFMAKGDDGRLYRVIVSRDGVMIVDGPGLCFHQDSIKSNEDKTEFELNRCGKIVKITKTQ